jgi:hypothetical protein
VKESYAPDSLFGGSVLRWTCLRAAADFAVVLVSSKVFFLGAGESLAPVDHELPVAAAVWWDFLCEVRPLSPAWFLPSVSAERTPPPLLRPLRVTLPAQFFLQQQID